MSYADFLPVEGVSQPHSIVPEVRNAGDTRHMQLLTIPRTLAYGSDRQWRLEDEEVVQLPWGEALSVREDPLLSDQWAPTPVHGPGKRAAH